jgi:hypothetical protein
LVILPASGTLNDTELFPELGLYHATLASPAASIADWNIAQPLNQSGLVGRMGRLKARYSVSIGVILAKER